MLSPNAEQIETALDLIGKTSEFIRSSQRKELHSAVGQKSEDFQSGYELGLQTARTVIAQSMALVLAKVNPDDVL